MCKIFEYISSLTVKKNRFYARKHFPCIYDTSIGRWSIVIYSFVYSFDRNTCTTTRTKCNVQRTYIDNILLQSANFEKRKY